MKLFEVRDKTGSVVAGLTRIGAPNANLQFLIPAKPLDALEVFEKTVARDMRHDDKRTERFTVVRLEDGEGRPGSGPHLPRSITVQGRRWFDKSTGNTQHAATILVDGVQVEGVGGAYGPDDCYTASALRRLEELGILPKRQRHEQSLWRRCEELGIALHYSATDVGRRRDL